MGKNKEKGLLKVENNRVIKRIAIFCVIAIVIIGLFTTFRLWEQRIEYREIGEQYEAVFLKNINEKVRVYAISFITITITTFVTNLFIKRGMNKFFDEEKKDRKKLPNFPIAMLAGVIGAFVVTGIMWENFLMFSNQTVFEVADPIFNFDIGFYFFQKPFYEAVLQGLSILFLCLIVYTGIYYLITFNTLFDGISMDTFKRSLIKKQIFVYLIIVGVAQGTKLLFSATDVLFGKFLTTKVIIGEYLTGGGFVDTNIKVWAYVAFPIFIILALTMARRSFKKNNNKKAFIYALTIPAYWIVLTIIFVLIQVVFINPKAIDTEKKYIEYNMEYTKMGYNLNIENKQEGFEETLTEEVISENQAIINNTNIVDNDMALSTLNENQTQRDYYAYEDIDVSKYNIDGTDKVVLMSAREIDTTKERTYNNKRFLYTHGYGVVVSSANAIDKNGQIEYIMKDIPSDTRTDSIKIAQPRIYYGELTDEHVIVNAKGLSEFDYPVGENYTEYNYQGTAGIEMTFMNKLLMTFRTRDFQMLFSSNISSESKLLLNRNITQRAKTIAPFLKYDEDPYLVATDSGELVWVLDAYTTSNSYPYSQVTSLEEKGNILGTKTKLNYIRNSVKVLINAYTGETKFYITDRNDPLIMAYWKAYPELFQDIDNEQIPDDIWNHITYPEYLFNIQANILTKYNETSPEIFYRGDNARQIATYNAGKISKQISPYYTLVKDNNNLNLELMIPYTLEGKQNLIAYMTASSKKDSYGKLTVYNFTKDSNVVGPLQVDAQVDSNPEITKSLELQNATGLKIARGMVIVPIENTLLYIEPIYVTAVNESQIPYIKKVIIASGNKLSVGDTFPEALSKLLTQYALDIEVEKTDEIDDLIDSIIKANDNLRDSSTKGDWEIFGKDLQTLQNLLTQLQKLKEEKDKTKNTNTINNTVNNVTNTI